MSEQRELTATLTESTLFPDPTADSPVTWKELLGAEKEKDYFQRLLSFVESERAKGKQIYPRNKDIFNALCFTPFEAIRVVILGQDPYHGPDQAHGLCFSVPPGIEQPPSLRNIFREINDDIGCSPPKHGCLTSWAKQGVLLLNAVLTVEAGKAGSHAKKGWEEFTDTIIQLINKKKRGVVFLLWGSYAQKKAAFIERDHHTVLSAPHPSPLSAHRGFFGCRHFSKANQALITRGYTPIEWEIASFPDTVADGAGGEVAPT